MVDFDAAVAAVQDPNADPVFLAKIAYENPEFGANVVANPRAYPGLKRWVAEFGDERARQQLVAMGWPVPQNGVQPQPIAEPTAQPMAEPVAEQVQPEQQYQPAVAEQFQQEQQYQPEQPVNQQYGQDAAYAASNEASTEYVDPYMNPADLSEVADYSSSQPQNEPEQQYAEQPREIGQRQGLQSNGTAQRSERNEDAGRNREQSHHADLPRRAALHERYPARTYHVHNECLR